MISAIVLAAGESRRMGQQKVLLPFGSSTILGEILDAIEGSCVAECIVVTGHNPEPVEEFLAHRNAFPVHNPGYVEGGMLSSIRTGLRGVSEDATGVMLFLGDQPQVSTQLIEAVAGHFAPDTGEIIVPTFQGRRGHPLLFDAAYRDLVLREFDDVGLRGLLRQHPDKVRELPWEDEGVLIDLDTPEDYAAATKVGEVDAERT